MEYYKKTLHVTYQELTCGVDPGDHQGALLTNSYNVVLLNAPIVEVEKVPMHKSFIPPFPINTRNVLLPSTVTLNRK